MNSVGDARLRLEGERTSLISGRSRVVGPPGADSAHPEYGRIPVPVGDTAI